VSPPIVKTLREGSASCARRITIIVALAARTLRRASGIHRRSSQRSIWAFSPMPAREGTESLRRAMSREGSVSPRR
jgi:hypothetical protein